MTDKDKQRLKNYYLITQGLIITHVISFEEFTFLYPHGAIFNDRPYQDQSLGLDKEAYRFVYLEEATFKKALEDLPEADPHFWGIHAIDCTGGMVLFRRTWGEKYPAAYGGGFFSPKGYKAWKSHRITKTIA